MKDPRVIALSLYLNRTSALFAGLIAFGAFAYGVLLLTTVMHAASEHTAQARIHELSARVAQLESRYLAQTQSITPDTVSQLGFVVPQKVSTVYTNTGDRGLSINATQ